MLHPDDQVDTEHVVFRECKSAVYDDDTVLILETVMFIPICSRPPSGIIFNLLHYSFSNSTSRMFSKRFRYRYGFTHASPERHFRLMGISRTCRICPLKRCPGPASSASRYGFKTAGSIGDVCLVIQHGSKYAGNGIEFGVFYQHTLPLRRCRWRYPSEYRHLPRRPSNRIPEYS